MVQVTVGAKTRIWYLITNLPSRPSLFDDILLHAGFYELAIFHLKPGYLSQFAHRTLQGLPARLAMNYPHPLGFWFTEFGLSNHQGGYVVCDTMRS